MQACSSFKHKTMKLFPLLADSSVDMIVLFAKAILADSCSKALKTREVSAIGRPDAYAEFCSIAMYNHLSQNILHDRIKEATREGVALSETSRNNKRCEEEVSSYLDGVVGVAQSHSAYSDQF